MTDTRFAALVQHIEHELSTSEISDLSGLLRGFSEGSELRCLQLPGSRSRIIASSGGAVHYSLYSELAGMFRKSSPPARLYPAQWSERFGRLLCDYVRDAARCGGYFGNRGFFTSDELPAYGVSRSDMRAFDRLGDTLPTTLVVLFAYRQAEARATKDVLDRTLAQLRSTFVRNT